MRVLVLYDKYSTYTNTVFDHLSSYSDYSSAEVFYCHPGHNISRLNKDEFDVIVIHYSLRIPLGQVSQELYCFLQNYSGLKVLFVQDEYDYTDTVRGAIRELNINLVFTCVPTAHIEDVYPKLSFPSTVFVNNLTGYIPTNLTNNQKLPTISERPISVGYRGRKLPYWYGDLGQEKYLIAKYMDEECVRRGIVRNIKWEDECRIYGIKWIEFLLSCRATLGTESGSNVFDDSGQIRDKVNQILGQDKSATYEFVRNRVMGSEAEKSIMNQISPRLFESIALKTGLILYEGEYSSILNPYVHYIPLRKDHKNVGEVFRLLMDDQYMQEMVDRAYVDIIQSDKYSYRSFIKMFDSYIFELSNSNISNTLKTPLSSIITSRPLRVRMTSIGNGLKKIWNHLPYPMRESFQPIARRVVELVSRSE